MLQIARMHERGARWRTPAQVREVFAGRVVQLERAAADQPMRKAIVAAEATARKRFGADRDQLIDDRGGRDVHACRDVLCSRRLYAHRLCRFEDVPTWIRPHLSERHTRTRV